MKMTIAVLLTAGLQVSASGYAQKITLSQQNAPIEQVLKEIKKQTGYLFFYNHAWLKEVKAVNIDVKKASINQVLDICFNNQPLVYSIVDKTIILSRREAEIVKDDGFSELQTPPQEVIIRGQVTDSDGETLPGVSIKLKGTAIGAITDQEGRYIIHVPDNNSILVFTYIGFTTEEVPVNGHNTINVQLKAESSALNEVVVVGYGTQKRSDLTGSVVSVKPSEIQQTPITSIDQGLAGRASGVLVTQTSGMPGAIASIRIRGSSSLQGGNEPLYVIDGVPVYNGSGFGETGGRVQMSGLTTINPSDIESIDILKDASATAIYGSRAANGVVLITTKGGKKGKDVISFDSYYGIQSVVKKIDVMDATNYAKLVNEAYTNDGLPPPYSTSFIAGIPNQGKGTDWQNEIFRSAPTRNYQLTFSGGDEKTTYSASGNYLNQNGIIINSDFKRYSGRLNLNRKMNERFNISSHISLSRIISNTVETDATWGGNGVITAAMKFNPILAIYQDPDLHIYNLVNVPGTFSANPVATVLEMKRKNNATRVLGDFSGEFTIMEGLKAKVLFGIDYFMQKANRYIPSNIYQSGGVASAEISDAMSTNWLNENTLTYFKNFDNTHTITLLAGATYQKNRYEGLSASSQGFVNDVLQDNSLGSGSVYNRPGSSATEWGIASFLGRANYSYKGKYLFTTSGRYDGSSRFGKNNKYAFFPSAAFGWKAGEEDFIKKFNIFSNLKLRTSIGVTGNQEIGLYNSLPTLSPATFTIGGRLVSGFRPSSIPNPDLKWERTAQYDAGLDMGFFNNRFMLTVDAYLKKTTDLIYSASIPFVSGFATSLQNIGSVQNRGYEIALETNNLDKALKWNTSFNISFNKSKVLKLGDEKYKEIGDRQLIDAAAHRLIVGQPISVFYGYVFDGIFQNPAELIAGPKGFTNWVGGRRYKDISGPAGVPDGKVDATYDRTIIGDPNPVFYGGLANTFSYKGVELNVFLQYSYGNKILNYNAVESTLPSASQNVYADLVNRWTPANPSNIYPKATTNRTVVFTDQYVEDGSYLKMKTVMLSYLFPYLKTKYINGLKMYVTGQNLLTSTRYRGYDPEVSYRGASNLEIGEDFGGYPQSRTFLFGVRFDLR